MGNGGDMKLLDWLKEYTFPVEAKFNDIEFARKVYPKVVQRQLQHGTTYCSYFATIHTEATKLLADECIKQGQRALVGKVNMDMNAPEYYIEKTKESITATEHVIQYIQEKMKEPGTNKRNLLVRPVITPRFAVSCTMELMKGLAQLAQKYNIPFQTHLSE